MISIPEVLVFEKSLAGRAFLAAGGENVFLRLCTRNAIAPLRLGGIERAVGTGEETVGIFVLTQARHASGNRYLHRRRECAPVEFGDDRAEPIEHARGAFFGGIRHYQQEFLAAIAAEAV